MVHGNRRQTDRHIDGQTDRETADMHRGRETDKETDVHAYRHAGRTT